MALPVPAPEPHAARPAPVAAHRQQPAPVSPAPWISYNPSNNMIRAGLAFCLVMLVALSGIGAMVSPEGMIVFEKILPALMLTAGFFFGRQG